MKGVGINVDRYKRKVSLSQTATTSYTSYTLRYPLNNGRRWKESKERREKRERNRKRKNITKTGPQLFANEVNAFSIHNSLSHWVEENAISFKSCVSVCVCITSPVKWGQRSSFFYFASFYSSHFLPLFFSSSPDAFPSAFVAALLSLLLRISFLWLFNATSSSRFHTRCKTKTHYTFFFLPEAYWDTHGWDIIDEYLEKRITQ